METGLLLTPWPVATAIMAPIAGPLSDRFPPAILGGIGMAMLACGLVLMATLPAGAERVAIVWRMLVCGAGFGFFQSPNLKAIMSSAPPGRSGGASGIVATSRLLGQSIGAALVALCFGIVGGARPGAGARPGGRVLGRRRAWSASRGCWRGGRFDSLYGADQSVAMNAFIVSEKQGAVSLIRLNRPHILNAWHTEMRGMLVDAIEAAEADAAIGALVLTGAGERAFCAGQDLNETKTFNPDRAEEWIKEWERVYGLIRSLSKPLVIALNGVAAGSGFQVALLGDFRLGMLG